MVQTQKQFNSDKEKNSVKSVQGESPVQETEKNDVKDVKESKPVEKNNEQKKAEMFKPFEMLHPETRIGAKKTFTQRVHLPGGIIDIQVKDGKVNAFSRELADALSGLGYYN